MIPMLSLRVEVQPMLPPKPICFGAFDEAGKHVGIITIEELRAALDRFEKLEQVRKK